MMRLVLVLATLFLPLVTAQPAAPVVSEHKGVGITLMGFVPCADPGAVGAGWWHNWTPAPDCCPGTPGFVPTIWGARDMGKAAVPADGPLFGYNEPDRPDQANMPAVEAARATAEMAALYPEHLVIGATISHLGRWDYYPEYLAELDRLGVRLYGLSLNCYESVEWCEAYVSQVRGWAEERNIPTVWLKEFRYDDPDEGRRLIEWLEGEGIYYAWFVDRLPLWYEQAGLWSAPLVGEWGLTTHGLMYRAVYAQAN